jgi:hypothetical protein
MNMRARNIVWLLPFFLTSCSLFHKTQQQPVQSLAPPTGGSVKPAATHPELPASATTLPTQPLATDNAVEQEPVPPTKHKKPKPVQQAANSAPPPPAPAESPGVPAVGVLSSGEPLDMKRETLEFIADTEHGLGHLDRTLSDQEQKTVVQIREYLKQSKEALSSGDVDGAHTLAAKAKAVFSELSQ